MERGFLFMHGKQAIEYFEQMCEGVEVNNITVVCLLSACSQAGLSQYICRDLNTAAAWLNSVVVLVICLRQRI
jgi:hypothetical protein